MTVSSATTSASATGIRSQAEFRVSGPGLRLSLVRLGHLAAREGKVRFAANLLGYLTSQISYPAVYSVYYRDLRDGVRPPALPEGIELRFVTTPAELDEFVTAGYRCFHGDTAYVRHVLARDVVLLSLIEGKEVLHTTWISTGSQCRLHLFASCIDYARTGYITDCFTRPPHRGRGLYPLALRYASEWLANAGFANAALVVEENNASSIASITHADFVRCGSARFRRTFFRSFAQINGLIDGIWNTAAEPQRGVQA